MVKTEQAKPQLCHVGYSPDGLQHVHQKTTKPMKLSESWEPIAYEKHLQHSRCHWYDGDSLVHLSQDSTRLCVCCICVLLDWYCFRLLSPPKPEEAGSFVCSVTVSLVSSGKHPSKAITPYTHWMWYVDKDQNGTKNRILVCYQRAVWT